MQLPKFDKEQLLASGVSHVDVEHHYYNHWSNYVLLLEQNNAKIPWEELIKINEYPEWLDVASIALLYALKTSSITVDQAANLLQYGEDYTWYSNQIMTYIILQNAEVSTFHKCVVCVRHKSSWAIPHLKDTLTQEDKYHLKQYLQEKSKKNYIKFFGL